ncbi:MAG: hypothetical protein AAF211_04180 [Myxococcota bacterium]
MSSHDTEVVQSFLEGLTWLEVCNCTALTTPDGLRGTEVELLDLRGCTVLEDVAAVEAMSFLAAAASMAPGCRRTSYRFPRGSR